jgi:hypothetical protein
MALNFYAQYWATQPDEFIAFFVLSNDAALAGFIKSALTERSIVFGDQCYGLVACLLWL